jgi:hypothetical protein
VTPLHPGGPDDSGAQRIVLLALGTTPCSRSVRQRRRGRLPASSSHDNDSIFGQFGRPVKVERDGRTRSYRCHLDRWLHEVMGIDGLPIPYGAPNGSPHDLTEPPPDTGRLVALPVLGGPLHDYRLAA